MFRLQNLVRLCLLLVNLSQAAVVQRPLLLSDVSSQASRTCDDIFPGVPHACAELEETFKDRLMTVAPIGQPCYDLTGLNNFDCVNLHAWKTNDIWTSSQAGGYYYNNWASCQATNESCTIPISGTEPIPSNWTCHQGSVPPAMIHLQNQTTLVDDIMAAFKFANVTKKPLVIKNTGHDWKGRSAAPDSLALWTHQLQHPAVPIVLNRNFTPDRCQNCTPETVFHYGPGQQWAGAYKFAEDNNFTVVGGTCGTVGIAGWLHGGGHSPITPIYGMGADNLRQVEIVTPANGSIIANEHHNRDVFFAVRGGGGGTFGVVTNITYKALNRTKLQDFHLTINGLSRNAVKQYLDIIASNAVAWSEQGWGGYFKVMPSASSESHTVAFEIVNPNCTKIQAHKDLEPLIEFVIAQKSTPRIKTQQSWYDYLVEVMQPTNVHIALWGLNPVSRLLPVSVFRQESRQELLDALLKVHDDKMILWLMFVAPTRFNHTTTSALHPSWKSAVLSVRAHARWDQYEDTKKNVPARKHFEDVHRSFEKIRKLAPDMGISLSESEIWEENHTHHFWGQENYERLLKVKRKVDPDNILSHYHAVGWDRTAERFKCYPKK